jgi:hypothetical protein
LTRWRNYFSQLLNVHGDNDVKQTEIHAVEPLVPEPSAFEVHMAIEKLKRYKSSGIDQIPAERIRGVERRGAYKVLWGNLREGDHLEDPGVDGRIILKWTCERLDGCAD